MAASLITALLIAALRSPDLKNISGIMGSNTFDANIILWREKKWVGTMKSKMLIKI